MYLRFEDWSDFTPILDEKKLPHSGRIIKVFSSVDDPRELFDKPTLTVVQADSEPFADTDEFDYRNRATYTGAELEAKIAEYNLTAVGAGTVRSLFRFGREYGFNQAAMAARTDSDWLIDHPFKDIDGMNSRVRAPKESILHLDIFFPASMVALKEVVDYDNPTRVMTVRERIGHRRKQWEAEQNLPA